MKRLFKLTTVALGLVVLGSCSNEDLFNSSNGIAGENGKGTLAVNVENPSNEMGLATRALTDENMSATIFEKSDKIRVYDNELHRWDGYQFDGSKFSLFTEADLTAPEFAIYPFGKDEKASDKSDIIGTVGTTGDNIGGFVHGEWSKGGITTVEMLIPSSIYYKEVEQTDGTTAYWCSLPMWGKVTSTEGKLETDLKYMTAILRVSLKNAKTNVDHLRISAFKDEARTKQINLSGVFEATLNTSDFTKTQLGETLGNGELYVDVSNIAGSDAYVFVPIVPCTNAIVVIEYLDLMDNPVPGKDGKTEKVLSQKNYVRGTLYKAKGAEFDVTTGSVKGINSALVAAKAQTEPVEISANVTTIATAEDNEIIIPAGMKADITLDLKGIDNILTPYLYINDENSENPYKGNITVKTATATTTPIVTQLKGANVQFVGQFDVLKSYVKGLAIGDGETTSTATLVEAIGKTVENVVIAKDATVTGDIVTDEDSEIDVNVTVAGTAGDIQVTGDVIVDGGTVGNIGSYTSATDNCLAKSVKVTGAGNAGNILTKGDVTITDATVGKIGSANVYANDVTITASADKAAATGTVNAEGNITTEGTGTGTVTMGALTNKSESTDAVTLNFGNNTTLVAINLSTSKQAATINFTGTAKATGNINAPKATINLKNSTATNFKGDITADYLLLTNKATHNTTGFIHTGKLVVMKEAQVKDAQASNNVLVKLDGEAEAITGTLTISDKNTEGMQISIQKGYVRNINLDAATKDVKLKLGADQVAIATVSEGGSAKLVPAAASVWDGKKIKDGEFAAYKAATTIYTATQLASMSGATDDITLANNIDLASKAWAMPALTKNFTGKNLGTEEAKVYPEIKNLYLKAEAPKTGTATNIGLFSTIATGKSVKNITINGVTSALTAHAEATTVPQNIGAVVGFAQGSVTIDNVVVKALNITSIAKSENIGGLIGNAEGAATIKNSKVTATDIQGQYNLGGLIGYAQANATLEKTTVAITKFTVIDHAAPGLGSLTNDKAGSVGMYFGKINGNVDADSNSDWGTSAIKDKRAALGYHQNYIVDGTNVYFYYGGYDGVGLWEAAGNTLKDVKHGISTAATVETADKYADVTAGKYNQYVLNSKWK